MQNSIFVISGEQGEGKSTFLERILEEFDRNKIKFGGILARGQWKNNIRDNFELIDLKSGSSVLYCQKDAMPGWEKIRSFYINPAGADFGENALQHHYLKDVDIIIIDELGPYELMGKGWTFAVNEIINNTEIPMIWVIRESHLQEILAYFKITTFRVFYIKTETPKRVSKLISEAIKGQ